MADQIITMKRGEPRFTHDTKPSATQRYAGSFVSVSGWAARVVDVWLSHQTIVLRTGNDGPDFEAFPRSLIETLEGLEESNTRLDFAQYIHALNMIRERRMYRAPRWNRPALPSNATLLGQVYNEDYTGVTSYFLFDREITEAEIRTWHPETYCQHEHDCCGHWYYNKARIRRLPNGCAIVRQRGYVNI